MLAILKLAMQFLPACQLYFTVAMDNKFSMLQIQTLQTIANWAFAS